MFLSFHGEDFKTSIMTCKIYYNIEKSVKTVHFKICINTLKPEVLIDLI